MYFDLTWDVVGSAGNVSRKPAIARSRAWTKYTRTDAIAMDFNHCSHLSAPFLGSLEKNFINASRCQWQIQFWGSVKGLTAVHVYNWIWLCVCVPRNVSNTINILSQNQLWNNRIKTSNSKSSQGIPVFFSSIYFKAPYNQTRKHWPGLKFCWLFFRKHSNLSRHANFAERKT